MPINFTQVKSSELPLPDHLRAIMKNAARSIADAALALQQSGFCGPRGVTDCLKEFGSTVEFGNCTLKISCELKYVEPRIHVGRPYRFTYPHYGTPDGHPDHTAHSGQIVTVVRQLTLRECDPENQPSYIVRATDGWEGTVHDSELSDPNATPNPGRTADAQAQSSDGERDGRDDSRRSRKAPAKRRVHRSSGKTTGK